MTQPHDSHCIYKQHMPYLRRGSSPQLKIKIKMNSMFSQPINTLISFFKSMSKIKTPISCLESPNLNQYSCMRMIKIEVLLRIILMENFEYNSKIIMWDPRSRYYPTHPHILKLGKTQTRTQIQSKQNFLIKLGDEFRQVSTDTSYVTMHTQISI